MRAIVLRRIQGSGDGLNGQQFIANNLLHCGGRTCGRDAWLSARAQGRGSNGSGEAQRFLSRLSRRHGSSVHARTDVRTGTVAAIPARASPGVTTRWRRYRRLQVQSGRFSLCSVALQVRCVDAAVGLPRLPHCAGKEIQNLRAADGARSHGSGSRKRACAWSFGANAARHS